MLKAFNNSMLKLIFFIKNIISELIYTFKFLRNNHHTIKKLKNSKQDKNVILLGNGNSVNLLSTKKILNLQKKNFDLIATNNFLSSSLSKKIVPNFYVMSDERTINPILYKKELKNISIQNYKASIKTINNLNKLKNIKLFLPSELNKKHNFKIKIYYFNNFKNYYKKQFIDLRYSNNLYPITGLNALRICVYLGYKKIYIAGIDNDHWKSVLVNQKNTIFSRGKYFYDKNYKLSKSNIKNISDYLMVWIKIFESYDLFKKFNIINLNPKSYITTFKKKHYLDIYK